MTELISWRAFLLIFSVGVLVGFLLGLAVR